MHHHLKSVRRAGTLLAAVAVVGGGLLLAPAAKATPATVCNNEGIPGDVWTEPNVGDLRPIFIGVDTGIGNTVGSGAVCIVGGGVDIQVLAGANPEPARPGVATAVTLCLDGTCTDLVKATGVETDTPGIANVGQTIQCVGTTCVFGGVEVRPNTTLYVNGIAVPLPACFFVGFGTACASE